MGYTLKLSIYCLSLRKKREERGSFSTFREFLNEVFLNTEEGRVPKSLLFERFKTKFESSFESKFVLNGEETKGIAISSLNVIPAKNIIDGMIIGGLTGVEQDIYDASSANEKEDTIEKEKVTALPYYFKLWMPYDSSVGVLMIQSYTEVGVTSLLSTKIKSFFSNFNYMIDPVKFVPREFKEKFKRESTVQKLSLYKSHLSEEARGGLNLLFTEFEGLQVKIEISGFDVSIEDFWRSVDRRNPLDVDLSSLSMESDYEVIATYKDADNKQSQARLSKDLDIFPTIIMDNELKEEGKEYPNYSKIQRHTNSILERVKIEIEYVPEDVS